MVEVDNPIFPHDRYLKSVLSDPRIAADFFRPNLPDSIRAAIDFSTLQAQQESFIDEKLQMQIADILFSAQFEGKPGYLYLLLEHTSTADKMLPFRMLKYSIAVMEHHLKINKNQKNINLPIVYPLMFYTGPREFHHSMNIYDLFGDNKRLAQEIYSKPYALVDITKVSDQELKVYHLFRFAAMVMKYIRDVDSLLEQNDMVEVIVELKKSSEWEYIKSSFHYLTKTGKVNKPEKLLSVFQEGLAEQGKKIMTLAEYLQNKGLEQGIEQGFGKGVEKVAVNLLKMGCDFKHVSEVTGLSLKAVKDLHAQIFKGQPSRSQYSVN